MKSRKKKLEFGFTLIEVIIALVVFAVVAVMMTSYFGKSITQSAVPISRLQKASNLQQAMEIRTAQYYQVPQWSPNTSYAAGTYILPSTGKRTGLQYKAIQGGISAPLISGLPNEPIWPIGNGSQVTDNTVIWQVVWPTSTPPTPQDVAAPALVLKARQADTKYEGKDRVVYPGNGYQYICTTDATGLSTNGTSICISNLPNYTYTTSVTGTLAWPTADGATTVNDGTTTDGKQIFWKQIGSAPTVVLQSLIGAVGTEQTAGSYSYRVLGNGFVTFTFDALTNKYTEDATCALGSCPSPTGPSPVPNVYGQFLKVSIGHPLNTPDRTAETITTLFTLR